MVYDFEIGINKRQAEVSDLEWLSNEGGDLLQKEFFEVEHLNNIRNHQKDSIHIYTEETSEKPVGYSIVFALNNKALEDIKTAKIKTAFDIQPEIHLENSIEQAKNIYIALVCGFGFTAQVKIGADLFANTVSNAELLLARQGTCAGKITMERMGFEQFYTAPFIEYCYTKSNEYKEEIQRKIDFLNMIRRASKA